MARVQDGSFMVMLNRGSYYQNAILIHKGGFEDIKAKGLAEFKQLIAAIAPEFDKVVEAIDSWDKVKLLNVQVNHLETWHKDGLLCIGDAAHAMSPVGGVGINLAVQDAVATSNLLAEKLRLGNCQADDLAKVQKRREWPARMTQRMQLMAHKRFFSSNETSRVISVSWPLGLILRLLSPLLRRIVSKIIGIGFRPEHIKTREYPRSQLSKF
jgi:2-polyprenyl-6-methoxyphenol hydroxylase-like FAD-dependent oxidoreductase